MQRLRPPLAQTYPPGAAIGALYRRDREAGLRAAWLMSRAACGRSHALRHQCRLPAGARRSRRGRP